MMEPVQTGSIEASLALASLFGNAPGQFFWANQTGPLSE